MGATASLAPRALKAEAGGEARCEVKIRNAGTVVDQFIIDVLGTAAEWAECEPTSVNLLPGDEATVSVVFKPPKDYSARAGEMPFGVRIFAKEDPKGSTVEEGTLEVMPFGLLEAEIVPRTSRGRRRGVHEIAVDNRGNTQVNADLLATDADQLLRYDIHPPAIVCEPGTATFAKVIVRPKKRFWRGPAKTIQFQVTAAPQGTPAATADGAIVQESLIPKWLPTALAALLALALVFAVLWFTLFKPKIQDTAKDAAKQELQQSQDAAKQAAQNAGKAAGAAQTAQNAAVQAATGKGTAGAGGNQGTTPTTSPNSAALTNLIAGGDEASFRLDAHVATPPGTDTETASTAIPAGKSLFLTDIIVQNPQGDSGSLVINGPDGKALLTFGLDNFRDLDYHFVAPILYKQSTPPQIVVNCTAVTAPNTSCNESVSFSGVIGKPS